jgi:hypothetical protein
MNVPCYANLVDAAQLNRESQIPTLGGDVVDFMVIATPRILLFVRSIPSNSATCSMACLPRPPFLRRRVCRTGFQIVGPVMEPRATAASKAVR